MDNKTAPKMNILIIRLSAIGDVIHTLPTVDCLRNHFPGCTITWAIEDRASDLISGYHGVDNIIVFNRKQIFSSMRRLKLFDAAGELKGFFENLRRIRFDLVLDFQGLLKSGLIVFFSRGKRKLGYRSGREGSPLFYDEKVPAPDFHDHAIARHMALIEYLGIAGSPPMFYPLFTEENEKNVQLLFDKFRIDKEKPLVLFHPAARWKTKEWPYERAARLCSLLSRRGCRVVLVGGTEEKEYLDSLCDNENVKTLGGQTTLRELACIISKSTLMVSMDSGPMHLSCAVGIPVVALFGPTGPWRTGPFGRNDHIIRKDLPCSPCFKRVCPEGHHRCMTDITPEEVFEACEHFL
jgi:heptosyltransferase-1